MKTLARTLANDALDLDEARAAFERDGFLMVPNALDPAQLRDIDAAFKAHLRAHPADFACFSDSFITAPDVLPRTEAFDPVIENPRMFPLLERLIGPDFAFEELSLMQRKPTHDVGELKGWHHDPHLPPRLYAKACVTQSVDGVGRRPRGLPAGSSTAEQLMHVQRAANRKDGAMP